MAGNVETHSTNMGEGGGVSFSSGPVSSSAIQGLLCYYTYMTSTEFRKCVVVMHLNWFELEVFICGSQLQTLSFTIIGRYGIEMGQDGMRLGYILVF